MFIIGFVIFLAIITYDFNKYKYYLEVSYEDE